jgi:hypothetical protein
MDKLKIFQLLVMADKLNEQANQTVMLDRKQQLNQQFEAQRARLEKFFKFFINRFRAILNEIDGDTFSLRERGFDKKMLSLLTQIKNRLENIFKEIDENQPYLAAWELVDYVSERPTQMMMENLQFLAQHHLKGTAPEKLPSFAVNAQIHSLGKLKEFAAKLKIYMEQNPLLPVPIMTQIPRELNPYSEPSLISPDEETKA